MKKLTTLFVCGATLLSFAAIGQAVNAEDGGAAKPAAAATTATTTSSEAAKEKSTVTIHFYNKNTGAEISNVTQTVTANKGETQDVTLKVPDGFKADNPTLKVTFDLAQKSMDVYVTPADAAATTALPKDDKSPKEKLDEATGVTDASATTSKGDSLPATGSKSLANVALAASGVFALITGFGYLVLSKLKRSK